MLHLPLVKKHKAKKYCTYDCAMVSRKKKINQCQNCGADTTNPKYCSKSCSAKVNNIGVRRHGNPQSNACKQCGAETRNDKFCSLKCKSSSQKKNRSDAEIRARNNERWQRYQAAKKDQTPIDVDVRALQEIYRNCPEGYEVDHIHPISKGGLHEPSNLQYLTRSENARKGNKII